MPRLYVNRTDIELFFDFAERRTEEVGSIRYGPFRFGERTANQINPSGSQGVRIRATENELSVARLDK